MTCTSAFRWLAATFVAAALAGSGCSRKLATDPGINLPEGVFSPNAELVISSDVGNPVLHMTGAPGGGRDTLGTFYAYLRSPGITIGEVLDGTPANRYEILRRQSSGSYADIKDYFLAPFDRWLPGQWESYVFFDSSKSDYVPPTYIGRGRAGGVVTPSSPLTNEAVLQAAPVATINYTGPLFPSDTLLTISWDRVPGATRYWLEIFVFRNDVRNISELFPLGAFTPIAVGKVTNLFVGYVDAPATSYTLGGAGAQVFTYTPLQHGNKYRVRVTAVSADGRLIAMTDGVPEVSQSGNDFFSYSLRAVLVSL